jgi:hypothetical protein
MRPGSTNASRRCPQRGFEGPGRGGAGIPEIGRGRVLRSAQSAGSQRAYQVLQGARGTPARVVGSPGFLRPTAWSGRRTSSLLLLSPTVSPRASPLPSVGLALGRPPSNDRHRAVAVLMVGTLPKGCRNLGHIGLQSGCPRRAGARTRSKGRCTRREATGCDDFQPGRAWSRVERIAPQNRRIAGTNAAIVQEREPQAGESGPVRAEADGEAGAECSASGQFARGVRRLTGCLGPPHLGSRAWRTRSGTGRGGELRGSPRGPPGEPQVSRHGMS